MDLARLKVELKVLLQDPTVESRFTDWINDAMLELAAQFEVPTLRLRKPATLMTTPSEWLYDLRDASHDEGWEYHKRCFRVTSTSQPDGYILEPDIYGIECADPDHDQTGTEIQQVAIEADQLAVYPMATSALNLWFWRKPLLLEDDEDEPEIPDEAWHYSVLIPKVVLRAFRKYPDDIATAIIGDNTKALIRWENELKRGLYGDGSQIGWVSKMVAQRGVRVRGPRLGDNIGGGGMYTRRGW